MRYEAGRTGLSLICSSLQPRSSLLIRGRLGDDDALRHPSFFRFIPPPAAPVFVPSAHIPPPATGRAPIWPSFRANLVNIFAYELHFMRKCVLFLHQRPVAHGTWKIITDERRAYEIKRWAWNGPSKKRNAPDDDG